MKMADELLCNVEKSLSKRVRNILMGNTNLYIAGGYIRDIHSGIKPKDIDIWGGTKTQIDSITDKLVKKSLFETGNSVTMYHKKKVIQFVYRWQFSTALELIESFDFTCCAAAVWYDGTEWRGISDTFFEYDIDKNQLIYTSPDREEDVMGSMMRVLKFVKRGWDIPDSSIAAVLGRVIHRQYDVVCLFDTVRSHKEVDAIEYITKELHILKSHGGY